jgi:hypothetical protein
MYNEIEVLKNINKNTKIGIESCYIIYNLIDNNMFKEKLLTFIEEYMKVLNEVDIIFDSINVDFDYNDLSSRMCMYFTIKCELLKNNKLSNISRMLINGNIMGIIDVNESISKYANIDETILEILNQLKQIEENNIKELYKTI